MTGTVAGCVDKSVAMLDDSDGGFDTVQFRAHVPNESFSTLAMSRLVLPA